MNKGWIRIHIILSIVITILAIAVIGDDTAVGILILVPIYWGVLYLTRFLIKWIKEGFKED